MGGGGAGAMGPGGMGGGGPPLIIIAGGGPVNKIKINHDIMLTPMGLEKKNISCLC
jgi:hypothetical protein